MVAGEQPRLNSPKNNIYTIAGPICLSLDGYNKTLTTTTTTTTTTTRTTTASTSTRARTSTSTATASHLIEMEDILGIYPRVAILK